ncbi:hypothetical protein PVAP13_5NG315400 [Panicum virgatum]|uniref:Uncharacterized protein n=1 Tax=Panicum virgatum TaxID=38727 RepID=A0A8T0RVL2_PANVG|nr:hypothetical protein PVAP13_5NG315400 [Panicum virgatum]
MRLGSPTSTRYTTYRFKKIEPDCCPLLLCRPFSPCFLSRYRPNPRSALQVSSPPLSYGMDPRDNALPSSIACRDRLGFSAVQLNRDGIRAGAQGSFRAPGVHPIFPHQSYGCCTISNVFFFLFSLF